MNRTTATHEAGHAVGRLLTARTMGYDPMEAVEAIKLGGEFVRTADGSAMRSQGQTMGPMLSARLEQSLRAYAESKGISSFSNNTLRNAGSSEDIRTSALSTMLICVMGAAAESKQQRVADPTHLFCSPACSGDRTDFLSSCDLMNLSNDEAELAQTAFLAHAKSLIGNPTVWSAVNAIAFALVKAKDEMSGEEVHRIAWPHLQGTEIDALPQGWGL